MKMEWHGDKELKSFQVIFWDWFEFSIFLEKHVGLGVRWQSDEYPVELSIAFPFVTINMNFGECYERVYYRQTERTE